MYGTLERTTQLIRAALRNDLPLVLRLVQLGAPLNLIDDNECVSALHWASDKGHELVAKALLDGKYEGRGADVNLQVTGQGTPLMDASEEGHDRIVRMLLARGADRYLQDHRGWTALHHAVTSHRSTTVKLLCEGQPAAKLMLQDGEDKTPLDLCQEHDSTTCEAVLREHGATA